MRDVMKKLGRELDEAVDMLGANHKLVTRTRKRFTRARATIPQGEEIRNAYILYKEYIT